MQSKHKTTLRSVEAEPLEVRVQEVCVHKALVGLVSLCSTRVDSGGDCSPPPRIIYSVTASVSQKQAAGLVPLGGIAPRDAPDLSGSTGLFYNNQ